MYSLFRVLNIALCIAYLPFIDNNTSGTDWLLSIKKATALSEHDNHPPANLFDGKASTFYHSSDDSTIHPWIQLELTDIQAVKQIKLTNRNDHLCKIQNCATGLSKVEVRVGNNQVTKQNANAITSNAICGIYHGPGKIGEVGIVMCPTPLNGRYVTIQVTDSGIQKISLAEVVIYGQIIGIIKNIKYIFHLKLKIHHRF